MYTHVSPALVYLTKSLFWFRTRPRPFQKSNQKAFETAVQRVRTLTECNQKKAQFSLPARCSRFWKTFWNLVWVVINTTPQLADSFAKTLAKNVNKKSNNLVTVATNFSRNVFFFQTLIKVSALQADLFGTTSWTISWQQISKETASKVPLYREGTDLKWCVLRHNLR